MKQAKNLMIILLLSLIVLCSIFTKRKEPFIVKNMSGPENMNNTSIMNTNRFKLINKMNLEIKYQKPETTELDLIQTRWYKILDISKRTDVSNIGDVWPTYSIQLDVYPNSYSVSNSDGGLDEKFHSTAQIFTAGGSINGPNSSIQAFRKDFADDVPFDYMVIVVDGYNSSIWLHSTVTDIHTVLATLFINELSEQNSMLKIKVNKEINNSYNVPSSLSNYLFPSGDMSKNWLEEEDENTVLPNRLVERQVSKIYSDIKLKSRIMELNEKLGVVRRDIINSKEIVSKTKSNIDKLNVEFEETKNKIENSNEIKTQLETRQTLLENELPYCRDSDFNHNEDAQEDDSTTYRCCPDGWYRDKLPGGELSSCKATEYPYDKLLDSDLTLASNCMSLGGTVRSSDSGEWECNRNPSKQLTFTTNTFSPNLCGKANAASTVQFTGAICDDSDNIRWDDVQTIGISDPDVELDTKACRWNRSGEQPGLLEEQLTKSVNLLGLCGEPPQIQTIQSALSPELPINLQDLNSFQTNDLDKEYPKIPNLRAEQSVNCIKCKTCTGRGKQFCNDGNVESLYTCKTRQPEECSDIAKTDSECQSCMV